VQPSIGRIVHYVSYGTPGGEYKSCCRAAVITAVYPETQAAVGDTTAVSLCVMNPTGLFFNEVVRYHDGAGQPGDPACPNLAQHGNPFRYCTCGWTEASLAGGTWHWPERV
jgi:hypothetical protein